MPARMKGRLYIKSSVNFLRLPQKERLRRLPQPIGYIPKCFFQISHVYGTRNFHIGLYDH